VHPYRAVRALRSSNGIKRWSRDDDAIGYIAVTGVGSPLFEHAFDICQKLIRAGLPHSIGTGG
jgi:hypothetical protein